MIQYLAVAYILIATVICFITTKDMKSCAENNVVENMSISILYLLWLPILIVIMFYYIYRGIKWYIDCLTGKF